MNLLRAFNAMADAWAWQVLHVAWQAALVGCVAILIVRWATRAPAPIRYALLLIALAKFAFPPLLSLPTGVFGLVNISKSQVTSSTTENPPEKRGGNVSAADTATRISELQGKHPSSRQGVPSQAVAEFGVEKHGQPSQIQSARELLSGAIQSHTANTHDAPISTQRLPDERNLAPMPVNDPSTIKAILTVNVFGRLVLAHALGMVVCVILLVIRMSSLQLRRRLMKRPDSSVEVMFREVAKSLSIRRIPELLISSERTGPYSFGVLRPTIVIPAICRDRLTPSEIRVAMAHELVHHRRRDLIVNAIQVAIAIVWWFHPVVWLLNRSIRQVREDCCDDALLNSRLTDPVEYCQTLLNVARFCERRTLRPAIAISMAADGIPLAERFKRIMDKRIARRWKFNWIAGLATALVAMVVLPGLSQTPVTVATGIQENAEPASGVLDPDEQARTPWPTTTEFRLLDVNGQPVADAPVEISLHYRNEKVEHYRSDAQGVVRVQWPKTRPQWLYVRVKSPDFVHQSQYWNQQPIKCKVPPDTHEFKLLKGIAVGGVVNSGSDGIAGVKVIAEIKSPSGSETYTATTNSEGRWKILNAPADIRSTSLQLIHEDYRSDPNRWSRVISTSDIEDMQSEKYVASLSKGKSLGGKVTDERGTPIENVQLKLVSYVVNDHALTLRSDGQGKFHFPHCDPNLDTQLVAFHPEYAPCRIPIRLNGDSLTQDVTLARGTPIRFRVIGPERKPVPGASLGFNQWHGVLNTFAWDDRFKKPETDENGICVWHCAPEGPFAYSFYRFGWTRPSLENISPSPTPVDVQMLREAIVTVRAIDESSGDAIQSFKLIPGKLRSGRHLERYSASQTTDGLAKRTIRDAEYQYFFRVEAPGFAPTESELHDIREGNLDLVLKLKRAATIDGVVREADGSLANTAKVILGTKDARPYIRAGGETHNHDQQLTTRADGTFTFTDPGDDFTLFVFSKSGFAHIRKQDFKTPAEIQVRPYARIEGQLLQDDTLEKYSDVKFEIEGQSGSDSPFGPHGYFDIQTVADATGKFTLELPGGMNGTLCGTKVLAKRGPLLEIGSGPSQTMSVAPGETYRVTLGQVGRSLVGQVRLDESLQKCRVSYGTIALASRIRQGFKPGVKSPTGHFLIDESGKFSIGGIPPGSYHISISAREDSEDPHRHVTLGNFQRWITIPSTDPGQAQTAIFDLGELFIRANASAQLQPSVGAPGREYFKAPRTDVAGATFNVRIRCANSSQQAVPASVKVWYGDKSGMHSDQRLADANGEVNFNDLPSHGAWIFVRADGFQATGMLVQPGTPHVDIAMVRNEEPRPLIKPTGWSGSDESSDKALRILLSRAVKQILEGHDEQLKLHGLLLLARHDAESAMDLHSKYAIDYPAISSEQDFPLFTEMVIKTHRSAELAVTDPKAADQLLKTIKDGHRRALAYTKGIKALAKTGGDKLADNPWFQSWVKLSIKSAEAEQASHWRAESLAGIAQTLLDLRDSSETASRALESAQAALKIPSDNERSYHARSRVVWELARMDVNAAMRLVQSEIDGAKSAAVENSQPKSKPSLGPTEFDRGRLFGNLAHQIALSDPVRAAQVINACPSEYRELYCARVCYRIAKLDLNQALNLARSCKTRLARGHALGTIAAALVDSDRNQSLNILREAFDELEKAPVSEEKIHTAVSVACSLLPVAAKIDQQSLDTFKWHALAMRSAKQCHSGCRGPVCDLGLVDQTSRLRLSDGLLGATLARYDAELGRQIAFAAGDDTLDLPLDKAPYFLFGVGYLTAPEKTVLALSALPLESTVEQRVALSAIEQVVGMVGLNETERWEWLFDEQFQVWRPDKFDF